MTPTDDGGSPVPGRVTVLVPARDEAPDIGRALEAIRAQDLPRDRIEVVVVDGASHDGTADVARRALDGCGFARVAVLANPSGTTPSSLNLGLAEATGEVLCRVDARSIVPPHYLRRCVEVLASDPSVAVVGGAQVAIPRDDGPVAVGIARALNNRWGMGFSRYRRGAPSGPADTVYLGAFRTADLRAAGGWDEHFTTNQDFELNRRMARQGTVWFASDLRVGYLPRATLGGLARQYRRFGSWKVDYWRTTGDRPQPRQLVLLALPVAGLAGAAAVARRGPRAVVAAGLLAAAGATAVEVAGADEPPATPAGHAVGVLGLAAAAGGWTAGVWSAALRRR